MSDATHAEKMVAKLEELLLANAGVDTVVIDGVRVSYADLEAKLNHWKRQVANEQGTNPRAATIDLSNAH